MLLVKWEFCVCSCILIITQTFSNFSVFSCSTAVCIKGVCVPRDGSHKCNFQKKKKIPSPLSSSWPPPPPPSSFPPHPPHLWLYVISSTFQPLKSCMGFSVLLLLDMKPKSRLVSEDLIQIKKKKKSTYCCIIPPLPTPHPHTPPLPSPSLQKKNTKTIKFTWCEKNWRCGLWRAAGIQWD